MPTPTLTRERLQQLLHLDPVTYRFTWKIQRQRVHAGTLAGSVTPRGYRVLRVDGVGYLEHRLVWLYVYGRWPAGPLDHVNCVKLDNRPENLREVSHIENMQNQPSARTGTATGFAGVRPHNKRFQASVRIWGVRRLLGTFDTPEQAYEACKLAKAAAGIPTRGYAGRSQCA